MPEIDHESPLPKTDRLELRLFEDNDAQEISRLMTPGLSRWLATWPENVTQTDALKKISSHRKDTENKQSLAVAIVRREDKKFLGTIIVRTSKTTPQLGEIGYWIGEQYQGKGYLGEILNDFVDYTFQYLGITTLRAGAQLENKSSFAIMEKMGMKPIGKKSVYVPSRDRDEEVLYYSLTRAMVSV